MKQNNDDFGSDLKPSQDDIALRQRQLQTNRKLQTPTNDSTSSSGVLIAGVWLIALAAVLIAVFAVWKIMAMQDKLNQADAFLSKLDSATETLQESVSETGAKASLSTGALKSLVKENNAEIRKLWYVSNDRNKKAIKANQQETKALQAENKKLQQDLRKELSLLQTSLTEAQAALASTQSKLVKQIEDEKQARAKIATRVNQLRKTLASLPELELRVGQNEEVVQSLEIQLTKLEQDVTKLKTNKPAL